MTFPEPGPAAAAARWAARRRDRCGARPYPVCREGAAQVALAATRALVHAEDAEQVHRVVRTAIADLGGAVVPARLEPDDVLGVDVSLGRGEPLLVVADPVSVAALELRAVVPLLVADARAALDRLPERPVGRGGHLDAGPTALPQYLDCLSNGDGPRARSTVEQLLRVGVRPAAVAEQVLAPAQRAVGEHWYAGRWTVADEHAATSLTETAVLALPLPADGPDVVFAAPEGEWHTLPGRLAAVSAAGVRSVVLGPGLPSEQLARYVRTARPAAVALSCTMATNLIAAADAIAAVQGAGVPVIAGGRAFGPHAVRALALGADGWATGAGEIAPLLSGLLVRSAAVEVPHEARVADAAPDELLELVLERHAAGSSVVRDMAGWQRRQTLLDLRWITRHAAAAHATGDPRLVEDLLHWLAGLLSTRGLPRQVLADGVRYLAETLEAQTPRVAALLAAAADAVL